MKELPQQVSESVRRRNPHLYTVSMKSDGAVFVDGDCVKPPKRIRQSTKPLMNKLEQEWFEVLKLRFTVIMPQSLRFMLGNGVWYKPDFVCWPAGFDSADPRMRAFECKGPFAHRGGFENLKIAATKYPAIRWTLAWKENGEWKEQLVLP